MKGRVAGLLLALMLAFTGLFSPAPANAQEDTPGPRQVVVGMYINDIQAIDMRTHSYGMDFYLWFRWSDPDLDPAGQFEFMNTFDPEAHVETVLYDEPQPQPDGSFYQIIRHQGLFSAKFPVGRYPFDSQLLVIAVEDTEEGAQTLQYVADSDALVLNPDIQLPGFDIGTPRLTIRDKAYATAFGDLSEPDVSAYSRAEFIVPITRPRAAGVMKTFIPVLLIILCAAFSLLLDPEHVEARIGLAITALLSLVAMQFTMLSSMPEVAYLTMIDQVSLATYLYILVVIAMVVRGTRLDNRGAIRGDGNAFKRLTASGPFAAVLVTAGYLAAIAAILSLNLA